MDSNSLIEGHCKFRDGKKWKTRWAVVTKLSPVADCLQLQIYRDEKERARNGHTKASLSLQHFLAMESGFTLDKESHTLAIICQDLSVVLSFDNRERLIQWSVRIANNLGEGQQFLVQLASAPVKSKLTPGPVKLHITDRKFCLTGGIPPRLLGAWEVSHLRRYGLVDGRLVFEGGSRCGKGEGVHVLVPDPPQISVIIDALDMSAKGQLVRAPSRRFGAVSDSPRKSMSTRLSEMRTLLPAESTTNISINTTNLSYSATLSPTPRESRSAEELCSACTTTGAGPPGSFWMSSEASSRCDLDSYDNLSVAIGPDDPAGPHVKASLSSPVRGSQLQIAKPLPSSMERCLSCMSKLGQQGNADVLSPSWTMDLNVTASASVTGALSAVNTLPQQGSIGSGNSDRLSISSHGSSGGVAEFYNYDTPRSVLLAEARRAARANTPPGPFQYQMQSNGQCYSGSNNVTAMSTNNHFTGQSQPSCSSPHKMSSVRSNGSYNGHGCPTQQNGYNSQVGCAKGCHCQNHAKVSSTQGGSPLYYNSVVEQKVQGGKTPINLHGGIGPGPGPYENYDFPRCSPTVSVPMVNQVNCCVGNSGSCGSSTIDWTKKQPMDRSSIASSAIGSDLSEFYDTPRASCACCTPPTFDGCHNSSTTLCKMQQLHCSHNGSTVNNAFPRDPMENYDVPPPFPFGANAPLSIPKDSHCRPSGGTRSVNGEGKMPLVTGSLSKMSSAVHPNAIYAQVDKSKKTPRLLPQHTQNCGNCDTHLIYENRDVLASTANIHQQPNYMNLEMTQNIPNGTPTRPNLLNSSVSIAPSAQSNYVNLDFAEKLPLYENSREMLAPVPEKSNAIDYLVKGSANQRIGESTCEPQPKNIPSNQLGNVYENVQQRDIVQTNDVKEREESNASPPEHTDEIRKETAGAISNESQEAEAIALPLRRSSSVPCKGGHANRGSASSSDSGVSGDGGLFFEDSSPLNDFGSLCLHESLPRRSQRTSPIASTSKNGSTTPVPKAPEEESCEPEADSGATTDPKTPTMDPLLAGRHYETIEELEPRLVPLSSSTSHQIPNPVNPNVVAVKLSQSVQRPKHPATLVSDANSTSSGASDMSDYIETLSSCSRGSVDTVHTVLTNVNNLNIHISSSPKRSTNMKPRSGKEYYKIDRSVFRND